MNSLSMLLLLRMMLETGVLSCSIEMCLRWNLDSNQIKFICEIDDLHFPVYFYDNNKDQIAYCTAPYPSPRCKPTLQHAKVRIKQYPSKNETVMIVSRPIDQQLNGNWSCRHGDELHEAHVDINILIIKAMTKSSIPDSDSLLNIIISVLVSVTATSLIACCVCRFWKYRKGCNSERQLSTNDDQVCNRQSQSKEIDEETPFGIDDEHTV